MEDSEENVHADIGAQSGVRVGDASDREEYKMEKED